MRDAMYMHIFDEGIYQSSYYGGFHRGVAVAGINLEVSDVMYWADWALATRYSKKKKKANNTQ